MTPRNLYIAPTNICNHNCTICAHHDHMRKERGFMKLDLFKKIVGEIPDSVHTVYLHKQGEPLLHPQFPLMLKLLKEARPDIKIKVNTNGTMYTDQLAEAMAKYVDCLTVSIWSVNKGLYQKLHGRDNLEIVLDNLQDFKNIRDTRKSKMEIWVDYVHQKGNRYETEELVIKFYKLLVGAGITISFWWCINFLGLGTEGNLEIYDNINHGRFPICIFPWTSMTICHDGQVPYCFVDPKEEVSFGNVKEQTIEEIYNSPKYQQFRLKWLTLRFGDLEALGIYCRKCAFLWSPQTQVFDEIPGKVQDRFRDRWKAYGPLWERELKKEGKSFKDFEGRRVVLG